MNLLSTADLCDENQDKNIQILSPKFKNFGGKKYFQGQVKTIQLDKSNWGLIELLKNETGKGKVLIVDAKQDYFGIIGDKLSLLAEKAGYEAIILNGYVRDTKEIKKFNLALYALGSCPKRCFEKSKSKTEVFLHFENVTFKSDDYVYGDEDGVIICSDEICAF